MIITKQHQKFNIFLNIPEQLSATFELHCAHSKILLILMVYHYNDSQTHAQTSLCSDEASKSTYQKTYAGLTYTYMETYIASHVNANMKVDGELRLIGACHKVSYTTTKKWFLETYPEIVEFDIDGTA